MITNYENLVIMKANILSSVYSSYLSCVLSKLYCFPVEADEAQDRMSPAR